MRLRTIIFWQLLVKRVRFGNRPHKLLQHACATNLNKLMAEHRSIHTWAFGHTHHSCDVVVGGTHVVSNQRGYDSESVRRYSTAFVVEVPRAARPSDAGKCSLL
jgi:hypothetical protein